MSKLRKKLLIFTTLVLIFALASTLYKYAFLSVRVRFADDQTKVFEAMTTKASKSSPEEAAMCLEYVLSYYPSDTKQEGGSYLDHVVERARTNSIRSIINYLRSSTGQDLGNEPEAWIKHYNP